MNPSGWGFTICITGVKSISVLFFFQTGLEGGSSGGAASHHRRFFFPWDKHLWEGEVGWEEGRGEGGWEKERGEEGKVGERRGEGKESDRHVYDGTERRGDARKKQGREGLICDAIQEPTTPT